MSSTEELGGDGSRRWLGWNPLTGHCPWVAGTWISAARATSELRPPYCGIETKQLAMSAPFPRRGNGQCGVRSLVQSLYMSTAGREQPALLWLVLITLLQDVGEGLHPTSLSFLCDTPTVAGLHSPGWYLGVCILLKSLY